MKKTDKNKTLKGFKLSIVTTSLLVGINAFGQVTSPVTMSFLTQDESVTDDISLTNVDDRYALNAHTTDIQNIITVTNNKIITSSGGIAPMSVMANGVDFINNGEINAEGTYIAYALNVNGRKPTTNITNSGTILAKGTTASSAVSFTTLSSLNVLTNEENGTIAAVDGNDNVSSTGQNKAIVKFGASHLDIINHGTIKGNIEGTNISLNNTGNIEFTASSYQPTEFINITNSATGIIKLNSENHSGALYHPSLYASTITLEDGSTLNINVANTTNITTLVGSTVHEIVRATTSLTVNVDSLNIIDNSPLIKFKPVIDGLGLDLQVLKEATYLDTTIAGEGQTPAKNAAKTLDLISDNSSNHPQMSSILERINNLTSDKDVALAIESTTPQSTTSTQTASSQISSNISSIAMARQNPNMGTGMNAGDEIVLDDKNLWIKPYGSIGSQGNKDGMNGFDVKSYGIGMGFDSKNKAEQITGVGLFFTDADVDMNNISQKTDLKAYSMMMYGSLPVIDNKTNFLYQLGYSLQKTDTRRDVFTGNIAIADYTSKMATVDARLVRDYQLNKNLLLQPLVSGTYRNFKSPSYSETGAGALNLDVEKSSASEMIVGLGTLATYKLNSSGKVVGNLNVGYDLRDDKTSIVSSYQGASGVNFETQGIDNGRWSYDIGVGYEKAIDTKNSMSLNYNFQGEGKDYINNVISANYIYKF